MKNYQLGIYEKAMPNTLPLEKKLLTAKMMGYDFLEMSIDETDEKLARLEMSKKEREAIRRYISRTGVQIRSICLSGHRRYPLGSSCEDIQERSLKIVENAIILACDLGVRIIQLAGYDVYYEESTEKTRADFLKNLKKSVEFAAEYGVILAFETMETPFMDTVEKAMYYVRKINSPFLKVYPDIGNCTNAAKLYGRSIQEDLLFGKGHIVAVHLKETMPGKYRNIEFGTGHVDFTSAIRISYAMGVRLFVTEFWDTPQIDYLEHIRYSKKFIDLKFKSILEA